MLVELRVGEQRYRAVWEVLDGASVTEVARRFKVSRQSVHTWLRRYAADGGLGGLGDRSSRPLGCPHQMSAVVEAKIVEIRRAHPAWGADRIGYQLGRDGVSPVPGRTSIYRALVRNGLVSPGQRKRRRADYRRWERARPMELWQLDVVGGFHLADGTELKAVSGIDDSSRFGISAQLVRRATARPVCEALLAALRQHGIPEQILTDNGKVFTGRFGPVGSSAEVLFDRICAENGIRHLLTAPRSPTTTGKVERWHKTIRAEFLAEHDHQHATIAELQAALDAWVVHYNTERPHQALGMRPPIERFRLASAAVETVGEPAPVPAPAERSVVVQPSTPIVRLPGVQRWVDQHGLISLAGFRYRVPIVLAGEPVEAVAAEHLVRIFHREVLVAEHVQRRKPDSGDQQQVRLRQGQPAATAAYRRDGRDPDGGLLRVRVVCGHQLPGRQPLARPARGSVPGSRLCPTQHRRQHRAGASDPARPGQRARRVRHPERAAPPPPGCAGRSRRQGHAAARSAYRPSLDPDPSIRRCKQRRGTTRPRRTMLIMSRRYRN